MLIRAVIVRVIQSSIQKEDGPPAAARSTMVTGTNKGHALSRQPPTSPANNWIVCLYLQFVLTHACISTVDESQPCGYGFELHSRSFCSAECLETTHLCPFLQ
ncbi:hypothetical protein TNCT_673961 [Trichonephila clavata]|uniref:Uncharacterized protein n=1 Tax=Trichonephila clavata TaxID=2740835 RepID=A0A8X6J3W9_TRICU|nr:hypothetical protein TNCT_673961 [Trichonephila clavata]